MFPKQNTTHHLPTRKFSRRRFFSGFLSALPLAYVLAACGKKEESKQAADVVTPANCRDMTGISKEDLAVREKLAYVDESPIPDNHCSNCNLYLPPGGEKKCGGCMLFKGPVEAEGYCTYWAPKI